MTVINKILGILNIIVGIAILYLFFSDGILGIIYFWIASILQLIQRLFSGEQLHFYIINILFVILSIAYLYFSISIILSGFKLLQNHPNAYQKTFASGLGLLLSCLGIIVIRLAINYLSFLDPLKPTSLPFVGVLAISDTISLIYPFILIFLLKYYDRLFI